MFGTLRSAHDVPVQLILTGNPGGPGQHWLAQRYRLIPFPTAPKVFERVLPNGKRHPVAVIPAKISDNAILMQRDPSYIDRLQLVGGPQLVKAWLEGDFSTVEGQFFEMWSESKLVLRGVPLPDGWVRFRAMDWGSASPFCVGWYAVAQDDWCHSDGKTIPRGAIIKYREWYGSPDPMTSDTGLKLTNTEIGQGIVKRERDDPRLCMGVLDPACFAVDGGKPIAEQINDELLKARLIAFHKADNRRVSAVGSHDKRGALSGWAEMRNRLIGKDGSPMLYFFDTCHASIRTIPRLQHDPMKAEDINTESVDHAADETRYACMARPWLRTTLAEEILKVPDDYRSKTDDHIGSAEWDRSWKAML
jgi:hypothetical protein